MLRVAEQYASTDTGRQRRANEDSLLACAPLFVVADGMGGAQAGEVASKIAVEAFEQGLGDAAAPESGLAERASAANARIYELSHSNAEHAGMGTTLTAVYVAPAEIAIAHVGDSRAYRLRDGGLERLTDDHSLVDELVRQGKITPAEAVDHPQRSVITRALGPEPDVEIDTRTYGARAGDLYLLCSDGLTTMIDERRVAEILRSHTRLRDTGEALIAAANAAGGRDNITVVMFLLEDLTALARPADRATEEQGAHLAPVRRRSPRTPPPAEAQNRGRKHRRARRAVPIAIALVVLGLLASGAYLTLESVYFIGTNGRGLVTLYRGVPYQLPGGVKLYSSEYVTGVAATTLTPMRRRTLLDHSLRSESDAAGLLRSLELGQLRE